LFFFEELKENLRSKLLNDIEQILSDTDPDDVLSISQAIDVNYLKSNKIKNNFVFNVF